MARYRIAGIFWGVKFLCILKILGVCEKNFVVEYSLNYTPCTREVQMASYIEVEAMVHVKGYHQYKEIWEAEVGEHSNAKEKLVTPQYFRRCGVCVHMCINGRGWLNLW